MFGVVKMVFLLWSFFRSQRARPVIIDPGLYSLQKSDMFWVPERRGVPTAYKLFTGEGFCFLSFNYVNAYRLFLVLKSKVIELKERIALRGANTNNSLLLVPLHVNLISLSMQESVSDIPFLAFICFKI